MQLFEILSMKEVFLIQFIIKNLKTCLILENICLRSEQLSIRKISMAFFNLWHFGLILKFSIAICCLLTPSIRD